MNMFESLQRETPTKAQMRKMYGKIDDLSFYKPSSIRFDDDLMISEYSGRSTIDDMKARARYGLQSQRATLEASGITNPEQKLYVTDDIDELIRRKELESIIHKEEVLLDKERKIALKKPLTIDDTIEIIQLGNRNAESYENMLLSSLPPEYGSKIGKTAAETYSEPEFLLPKSYIEDSGDAFGSFPITF